MLALKNTRQNVYDILKNQYLIKNIHTHIYYTLYMYTVYKFENETSTLTIQTEQVNVQTLKWTADNHAALFTLGICIC